MLILSALQHDALVELFNIGVGQAANALSDIVGDEVTMSVPTLRFLDRAAAGALLAGDDTRVCGVRQHYEGSFRTEAIVMFAEDKSLDIVRLMVGDAVPFEELTEMEQEAMGEIGNIVLNCCVGTLASLFDQELRGSLPVVQLASSAVILGASAAEPGRSPVVLMLHIDLALATHRIHGYIAFVLDLGAFEELRAQVDGWLARLLPAAGR
ncbi:chemotaxis protein CheC [Massilia sp. DWR3-1-1]|uniref:chemotaxis protein CheC n=1 Tax=Massilia sp. DWR3-1-1 TaxID=2804559 RepID=UPI003CEC4EF1